MISDAGVREWSLIKEFLKPLNLVLIDSILKDTININIIIKSEYTKRYLRFEFKTQNWCKEAKVSKERKTEAKDCSKAEITWTIQKLGIRDM